MKRIVLKGKFLLMLNDEAERFADLIEARTGQRPEVTNANTQDSQPNLFFGMVKPNYKEQ